MLQFVRELGECLAIEPEPAEAILSAVRKLGQVRPGASVPAHIAVIETQERLEAAPKVDELQAKLLAYLVSVPDQAPTRKLFEDHVSADCAHYRVAHALDELVKKRLAVAHMAVGRGKYAYAPTPEGRAFAIDEGLVK